MDGGSADIAGAYICPYFLYIISAESPCEIKGYLKGYHGLGCGCYS